MRVSIMRQLMQMKFNNQSSQIKWPFHSNTNAYTTYKRTRDMCHPFLRWNGHSHSSTCKTYSARYAEPAEAAKFRIDTAVRHSVTCKPSGISRTVRGGGGSSGRQFELTFESERRLGDNGRSRCGRSEHAASGSQQRSDIVDRRCRRCGRWRWWWWQRRQQRQRCRRRWWWRSCGRTNAAINTCLGSTAAGSSGGSAANTNITR